MKNGIELIIAALVVGVFTGVILGQNPEAKSIDEYVSRFAAAGHFSGVVLAAKDGNIIFEKAYGSANAEHDVPNRLDTKFGIASVNKPMTSVILIWLIEAGKISLEDKLSKFIPDFPNGDKITIEMLVRHRSGIPHRAMPEEEETRPYTPAEMAEKAKKAELAFSPGTDELYSSAGYAVLARVLEIVSGKPFAELLQEYVFVPAGMKDSIDFDSRRIIKRRAQDYLLEDTGFAPTPLKDYSFLVGAGSVFSSASDVYKFGRAVIDGKYGGIARSNLVLEGVFRSNGSTNGYRCNVRIDEKNKYGYVVTSNLGSGANDLVINSLGDILQDKQVGPPEIPNPQIDLKVRNNLPDYVGRYKLGGSGFGILIKNGELFAGPFKLQPLGRDRFYSFWSYADITFVRDEKGKVYGLEWVGSAGKSEWTKQ